MKNCKSISYVQIKRKTLIVSKKIQHKLNFSFQPGKGQYFLSPFYSSFKFNISSLLKPVAFIILGRETSNCNNSLAISLLRSCLPLL